MEAPQLITAADGALVALHDFGGSGPPLLICHATGFCSWAYQPLARLLAARFHVWGVDARGHGHSPQPADGNPSWLVSSADVLAAVDHMPAGQVAVFGHSRGGALALLAEAARPGWLGRGYVYEPVIFSSGFRHANGASPLAGPAAKRREVFASRAEALARYAARPPLGVLRADCLAAYVEGGFEDLPDGTVRLRCRAEWEAATYAIEAEVTVDRIAIVRAPVVVAAGASPAGFGPSQLAVGVAEAIGQGPVKTYPNLGHFGPLQDPESIAEDVIEALSRD